MRPERNSATASFARDHQLLDQPVSRRLALLPGASDTALAVELEVDLRALDAQRAASEAAVAHPCGETVGELERSRDVGLGLTPFGLRVSQPRLAADDRAVELGRSVRRHLNGDAKAVLVRPEAAAVLRQLGRQHRRDLARDVGRERALRRAVVERDPRRQIGGDVGDVDPPAKAVSFLLHRDRVVEVLRGHGIDREAGLVAQVDPVREVRLRRFVRLELHPCPCVDEQTFEHDPNVLCLPELPLEARTAAAGSHHDQVPRLGCRRCPSGRS